MSCFCEDEHGMVLIVRERQRESLQMNSNRTSSGHLRIRSGEKCGLLHLDKFRCPGIHEPCIEIGSELLTPSNFCRLGKKERLRDWKSAIFVGERTLRWLMEWKILDFWNHNERCTERCKSSRWTWKYAVPTLREEIVFNAPYRYQQGSSQDPISLSSTPGDISPTLLAESLFQPVPVNLKRPSSEQEDDLRIKKGKLLRINNI